MTNDKVIGEIYKELSATLSKRFSLRPYDHFKFCVDEIFRGINISEMTLLDIGSGPSINSIYLALKGAKKIVGIEPMLAGSSEDSLFIFQNKIKDLGLKNISAINSTFQEYKAEQQSFDILLSNNSINHLDEEKYKTLHQDSESWDCYLSLMKKAHMFLRPGGILIIADCSRYNLFSKLYRFGIKNTLAPNIDWDIHQHPTTWRRLLAQAGFSHSNHWWSTPYPLRSIKTLFSNPVTAWLTNSKFVIHAKA